MAKIANTAASNTLDYARARVNELADRVSQFAINNSSLYANNVIANNSLRALKNLTVSGNTTLGASGKTITVTGAFLHTGRATISTNLTVSANTVVSGLVANGSLGTSNYVLKTNGTTAFWAASAAAGTSESFHPFMLMGA
jgi:hypothetical protein